MSGHTEGRWRAHEVGKLRCVTDADGIPIASMHGNKSKQNSLVMAAAPDLLKALEACEWGGDSEWCAACESHQRDGHERDCIVAMALAKARGEG